MSNLKLLAFPTQGRAKTVPQLLRELASELERMQREQGVPMPVRAVVTIEREHGLPDVYGLGDAGDVPRGIGLMWLGIQSIATGYTRERRGDAEI